MEFLNKFDLSQLDSNTSFAAMGYWWTPENPDKRIAGVLKFIPNVSIELKLFGSLSGNFLSGNALRFINGNLEGGTLVTLYKNARRNSTFGTSFPTEIFSSIHCFFNANLISENELNFSEIKVYFSHLHEWLSPDLFEIDSDYKNKSDRKIKMEFSPLKNLSYNVPFLKCSLGFGSDFHYNLRPKKKFHLINDVFNSLKFEENIHLSEYSLITYRLLSFYSLLIGDPIDINKMIFIKNKKKIYWLPLSKSNRKSKAIDTSEMLAPFSLIKDNFENIINLWFTKNENLRPVYNLFFSSFFRSDQFIETHFLNMCQSLEVLHRRICIGKYLPTEDFKVLFRKVKDSIPKIEPEQLRNKLLASISHANEFGLSDRISELLNLIPDYYKNLYLMNNTFKRDIKNIRNHLTHYEGATDYAFFEKNALALFTRVEQMKLLLAYILLTQLGLTDDQIKSSFRAKFSYVELDAQRYFGATD